jgi:threonine dehydrogenase-like Zn-dependent dehydrogenase
MKTVIIVLIAGIVLSQLGISAATSSENSAARNLAAAKSFAFGGVGVAGLMSEGERNLRVAVEQSGASQQLQAALAHATPAGTLYILVGLRRCDRAAYQKVFDSLARPNDDVEVVRGCMISKEPFRQLLSQIQDGRFDDYLSRPPR